MHAPPAVPFVRSPLPWLGHGIAFGKDADALLQRLRARHGDAFTLLLGGKRMTFLLNPHDAPAFFKQSKTLVAGPISKEISGKAFGIDWSQYAVDVHEVQVPFDKSMRKSVIGPMTLHMQEKAAARLQALGRHHWQSGELFRFVAKLVFDAGGEAMLGDGLFDDPALFEEFLHFDKRFPLLVSGLPRQIFFRRAERFLQKLSLHLQSPRPGQAPVMDTRFDTLKDVTSVREIGRNNAGLFWATQANTVVMAFYAVFFILRDAEARRQILAELDAVAGSVQQQPTLTLDQLDQLEKLDACLDEVLRLKTSPMPIRVATQPVTLPLYSGRECRLNTGDIVCLFPRLTHMDPMIYPQPELFIWDRFLQRQGPNQFSYRGEPLKYNLLPFGGGQSICPGRHFARSEFKILTALLLRQFDIELLDSAIPPHDKSRAGLGALTPLQDVPFRFRLREPATHAWQGSHPLVSTLEG